MSLCQTRQATTLVEMKTLEVDDYNLECDWNCSVSPVHVWRSDSMIVLTDNPGKMMKRRRIIQEELLNQNPYGYRTSSKPCMIDLKPNEKAFSMLELVRTVQQLRAETMQLRSELCTLSLERDLEFARKLPAPLQTMILSYVV